MKKAALLSAVLLSLTAAGCGNTTQPTAVQTEPVTAQIEPLTFSGADYDDTFAAAQTGFALRLLQQTAAEDTGKNLLISPYSVMQALAMTANGADTDTLSQMEQTLGGIPIEQLNNYLFTQRNALPSSENAKFNIANSVWFRDDANRISVKNPFLETLSGCYNAPAYAEPFDDTTKDKINQWCSDNTDRMIPKIIDKIEPDDVMYLINAVCFDAKWQDRYENEPIPREFLAYDGSHRMAQMMHSEEHSYLSDAHAEGFIKYYQGGDYAFAALLPEQYTKPEDYLSSLTPEHLHEMLNTPEHITVYAGLPQFKYDYDNELSDELKAMGMPLAFDADADFSRMADTASDTLFISRVLHNTHIEVDIDGTKAAAVTAVVMNDECDAEAPEDYRVVILDRPFIYMIVETAHMTPIFTGILNDIPES